ncbi:FKBP-type peptidyl-prolyl cis-trans isomerase [Alysiella filiformis]|uniref:Peptidyl-prolyl cis-trans isomerase n=1 Tax=Alysiella filiformis DSM 16848 TaxID=1120981 RepID=A0A286EFH9_9NEIS|nr:FKBP-type peptidyl-prolyl cis-trans isomerase [Alysiella filiformis]QMT30655.1 FKBP-type peptidyl-prolyl cis-trans isomerase [Alysiella filiformis]UBQ56367.1 FKBP-type peptidyl-prolyl cis-trans isomerase [Alysiella filiformis DSM 16848]SOD69661.1 FKBP-type peptidyl-prolyl cis-trans isomerase FkpA [Alysiella filiformis DSM 16848]
MKPIQLSLIALATAVALSACNQNVGTPTAASGATAAQAASGAALPKGLESNVQQMSYIFGENMGRELALMKKEGGVDVDIKAFTRAVEDQLTDKPSALSPEQKQKAVEEFQKILEANAKKKSEEMKAQMEANQAKAAETLKAGEKFLAENKTKDGIKTTASGLQYKVNKEGTGETATMGDGVLVEYTGKLIDGTEFDSTAQHGGQPFAVPLTGNSVIKGWTEGLQLMKEGGEYTLYIPTHLAYGPQNSPKIPANSVLIFDMKIVKIEKGAAKGNAPAPKK